ncbi:MAG: fibronectin type III-like domain-contianing protein, partial [Cellulomonas sp.]|nr:fibronectin type III-like domain-contianing protein [Cellulomonas sp.]
GQQPTYYNQLPGQHGTRYADLTQDPAFAFGEGLSYTSVAYDDLVVSTPVVGRDDAVRARVAVTNTGGRPVLETVQVYLHDVVTSVTWAQKELKAYRQVALAPGERRVVELELPVRDCTLVDADATRVVEPGEFELLVGPSSRDRDLLHATFAVRG